MLVLNFPAYANLIFVALQHSIHVNQLNPLGSLLSSGQAAATNQAGAAGNYGAQAGQGMTNIGAANAAGTMASANALGNALGQYLNYSSNQNIADAIRRSTYG